MPFRIQPGVQEAEGFAIQRTFENIKDVFRVFHPEGLEFKWETSISVDSSDSLVGALLDVSGIGTALMRQTHYTVATAAGHDFLIQLQGFPGVITPPVDPLGSQLTLSSTAGTLASVTEEFFEDLTPYSAVGFLYQGQQTPGNGEPIAITSVLEFLQAEIL